MTHQRHEIVVYPSRAKLFRYLLLELAVLALMAVVFPLFFDEKTHDPRGYIALVGAAIGIPWIGVYAIFTAYRAIVRKPAVIVNDEGITDNGSLIVSGVGLMRWHEIAAVYPYTYVPPTVFKIRRPYLVVLPVDAHAALTRRGLLAQMLLRVFTFTLPARTSLPEWMLSIPIEELLSQMRTQYKAQIQLYDITLPQEDPLARMAREGVVLWHDAPTNGRDEGRP